MGPHSNLTLQFLSEPTDVNYGGKVHGGAVMKWIDQAGYACASQWAGRYSVTVYVGGIRFFSPILIGEVVQVRASVIHTGTSSMHLAIDVFSKGVSAERFVKKTHCVVVFVAVDAQGRPQPVPRFVPSTEAERQKQAYALKLMELRKDLEQAMEPFLRPDADPTDAGDS
ncbi:acyl-CoA thioesterase [bacterium]|nr:acyl-CoA thioesterase [bacterium]